MECSRKIDDNNSAGDIDGIRKKFNRFQQTFLDSLGLLISGESKKKQTGKASLVKDIRNPAENECCRDKTVGDTSRGSFGSRSQRRGRAKSVASFSNLLSSRERCIIEEEIFSVSETGTMDTNALDHSAAKETIFSCSIVTQTIVASVPDARIDSQSRRDPIVDHVPMVSFMRKAESQSCLIRTSTCSMDAFVPNLRSGAHCDKGPRETIEDVHKIVDDLSQICPTTTKCAFYGVFDGHGGVSAAEFAGDHLLENVLKDSTFPKKIPEVLHRAFLKTDKEFEVAYREGSLEGSGTTALVALVLGSSLVVANAGDCRAVLCRKGKAVALSEDQKPSSATERHRIECAGGSVCDNYINGELSVARAIGNWHIEGLKVRDVNDRSVGPIIADPEVTETVLTADDEFVILGCDGLWDVFPNEEAVKFARNYLMKDNDPVACSKAMVEEALERNTTDNCTAIVVCLISGPPPVLPVWKPRFRRTESAGSFI